MLKGSENEDSQEVIKRRDAQIYKAGRSCVIQVGKRTTFSNFSIGMEWSRLFPGSEQETTEGMDICEVELDGTRRQLYTSTQKQTAIAILPSFRLLSIIYVEVSGAQWDRKAGWAMVPPLRKKKIYLEELISGISRILVIIKHIRQTWMCPVVGSSRQSQGSKPASFHN
jgi:hypothetical protein